MFLKLISFDLTPLFSEEDSCYKYVLQNFMTTKIEVELGTEDYVKFADAKTGE